MLCFDFPPPHTFTLGITLSKFYSQRAKLRKTLSPITTPLHFPTLSEYLRGACLPFVTLTGDIVADSGINVLQQKIVLTGKQRDTKFIQPAPPFYQQMPNIVHEASFLS